MCGICGVAASDHWFEVEHDLINGMTQSLFHRGPDDQGMHCGPGIGLGMRRLSIIDLDTGWQPIRNEDDSLVMVFNGEIYNYPELRRGLLEQGHRFRSRSDAEVVLHLYESYGMGFLDRLRGMFALAIWDAARKTLTLARDRLGIKPLYYHQTKSGDLVFGSEIKAILASGLLRPAMDMGALNDVFTVGYSIPPRSTFAGVRHLMPGHYISFHGGRFSTQQYWDLNPNPQRVTARADEESDWADKLSAKLEETVKIHMRSDVELGAWLSPGLDSSGVTAIMACHSSAPVKTFSLGFDGSKEADELGRFPTLDQYEGQNLIGHKVPGSHEHFNLMPMAMWHKEMPIAAMLFISRYVLASVAAKKVKVVLTGEGADEVFGGYPWYLGDRLTRPISLIPQSMRRWAVNLVGMDRWRPGLYRLITAPRNDSFIRYKHILHVSPNGRLPDILNGDHFPSAHAPQPELDTFCFPDGFDAWHPFARMQYVEAKTRMIGRVVLGLDLMSMAFSLEARVPYLDHELVQLSCQIPISLRLRGFQEKRILRKALAKWLPKDIAQRKKKGLTAPGQEWLSMDLPDFARTLMSRSCLKDKGYFKPEAVEWMFRQHQQGQTKWTRILLGVLSVQLWDDLFIEGKMHLYS